MNARTLTLASDTRVCSYCREVAPYRFTTPKRTYHLCRGHASARARRHGLALPAADLLPFMAASAGEARS